VHLGAAEPTRFYLHPPQWRWLRLALR
jgi:hypothetical protein